MMHTRLHHTRLSSARITRLAFMLVLCISARVALEAQEDTSVHVSDTFCVGLLKPVVDTIHWTTEADSCIQLQIAMARELAIEAWQDSVARLIEGYIAGQDCAPVQETFTAAYASQEHHYTLYYYDQAGNLIQTVPPAGVNPLGTSAFPNGQWDGTEPSHDTRHLTRYRYNSLGQVVEQLTPDAGTTRFYYDRAQRLRFAQDARQAADTVYSYTKYDRQSRVIEVGQASGDPATLNANDRHIPAGSNHAYVMTTEYDWLDVPQIPTGNLQGRVARVAYEGMHTYYDYDAHGNVRTLTHTLPTGTLLDDTITIAYDYDLVSGNVQEVRYEPGEVDQFVHRYTYDADNRLMSVYSSDDGYIFAEDARYFYYLHGPLARVELGQDHVQGMDYYYTLQGWIKGVNMIGQTAASEDPGLDGAAGLHSLFAKDTTSYLLGYHDADYTPISAALSTTVKSSWTINKSGSHGLYNGNIALMLTNNSLGVQGMAYQYDALHRIRQAESFSSTLSANQVHDMDAQYDANGNISTLNRRADTMAMDALTYHYDAQIPNRLRSVSDAAGDAPGIDDVTSQSTNNYTYDEIGNLVKDNQAGTEMTWDVYNKLRTVDRNGTDQDITYTYDPQGNRLTKAIGNAHTDVYIRDAAGNVMAIYRHTSDSAHQQDVLREHMIYGSSRLGMAVAERIVESTDTSAPADLLLTQGLRGLKQYEQSNHLGNVLTVVADFKLGQDTDMDGVADRYDARIVAASDYYPFGMEMPGRIMSSMNHRFGFNGKEKDSSIGDLMHYDYGFRIYHPGIGRFLSVDPLTKSYPMLTPYQFASNKPMWGIDQDGLEWIHYLVKFTVDGDGPIILEERSIIKDWRHSSEEIMHTIHGRPIERIGGDNIKPIVSYGEFYDNFSQGFGPKGQGVLYTYEEINGEGEVINTTTEWDVRDNSPLRHGLYYGRGSVTKLGRSLTPRGFGNYDFSLAPIDMVDALARGHDMEQDVENYGSPFDIEWISSDIRFVRRLEMFLNETQSENYIDPYTGRHPSQEAVQAAMNAKEFFKIVVKRKERKLERHYRKGKISKDSYDKIRLDIQTARTQDLYLPSN